MTKILKPSDCFKAIAKSEFIQEYFDSQNKESLTTDLYYGFNALRFPLEILLQEPLLKNIHEKFPIQTGGYVKLDPNRCFRWHTDIKRKVAINMLLNSEIHSHTLFGQLLDNDELHYQYETVELKYEENTLYSFNTAIEHTVVNFEKTRWLFTVEFDSCVTYHDINAELGL